MGVTSVEKEKKGLYVSVYFPDMVVGTVGGGTTLATQQEALHLLHLAGGNEGKNSQKLAEIMASACLAGEISLLASLAQGSLSTAHKTLGRGMKQL
jgi:hydroxymethylglutaryl-CoA reductase (NADPH)